MRLVGMGLFLLLMMGSFLFSQQNKKNIAVLEIESGGTLTKSEETALTNRLRSKLVATNAFNVVERNQMDAILKEMGFQMSGCTSVECAVEVGRILNVQQMVAGNIGKIGSLFTLDINIIDVETARIVKSFSENYRGEIEGLIDYMEAIAKKIAGQPIAPAKRQMTEKAPEKKQVEKKGGGKKWLWILGGTAAAGGAAAAILLSGGGKDQTSSSGQTLPEPPTRP
ncbi:MAG: hypothetical protein Kow00108_14660 [Calditrichia bacterium]